MEITGLDVLVGGGDGEGDLMLMEAADTYGISRTRLAPSVSPSRALGPLSFPTAAGIAITPSLPPLASTRLSTVGPLVLLMNSLGAERKTTSSGPATELEDEREARKGETVALTGASFSLRLLASTSLRLSTSLASLR